MGDEIDIQIILPSKSEDTLSWMLETITEELAKRDPDSVAHGFLGGKFGYGGCWDSSVFEMRPYYWGDCDCGWMEKETAWAECHTHTPQCYWNVSREKIDNSEFAARREWAVKERDRHPWGSMAAKRAQAEVEAAYSALDKYEEAVRRELCAQHRIPWDNGRGSAVHCTCDFGGAWAAFLKDNPGHTQACALELPNFRHKASGFEVRWYKYIGRNNETKGTCNIQAVLNDCIRDITASSPAAPPRPS